MLTSNKIVLYSNFPLFNTFKNKVKKLFKTKLCKITKTYFLDETQFIVEYENNNTLFNIINYIGYYQNVLDFSKKDEVGISLTPLIGTHGLNFYSQNKELLNEIYEEITKEYLK